MVNPLFVDAGITKEIGPVSEDRTDRGIRRVKDVPGEDPQEMVADLFERYHAAIFAYHRLLGDRESANDLTQETFVKVYETRNRLPGVENQRAWVYRIATNLAIAALAIPDLANDQAALLLPYRARSVDFWATPPAPVWSPDDRWLAIDSFGQALSQDGVWVVRADGSEVRYSGKRHAPSVESRRRPIGLHALTRRQ